MALAKFDFVAYFDRCLIDFGFCWNENLCGNSVLQCIFGAGKPACVTIKIDNKKVARTTHERDRVWNQTFRILCAYPSDSTITITMKTKCSILGKFQMQAHEILNEASFVNSFLPLVIENGKPNPELKLRFMLWFKPAQFEPTWGQMTADNVQFQGLRNATFPQRSNSHVTLYQDAHHCSTFKPSSELCGTPRRLWEDVYKAMEGAKNLIYIAGWSFNPKMVLVNGSATQFPSYKLILLILFLELNMLLSRSGILKQTSRMREE